jgi:manganese transport protein
MNKSKSGLGKKVSAVMFWSIISAAFIGPGTVTTAAKSGSEFGLTLLWALVFSTVATIFLQESAARLTMGSGKNLGAIIKGRFRHSHFIRYTVFACIAFGCAAYQTGNVLGAVSGMELISPGHTGLFTVFVGIIAAFFLWRGSFKLVARGLGLIVAFMGTAFLIVAIQSRPEITDLLSGAFVPTVNERSLLLTIGLIGTTIVPYNLFLASGISRDQTIQEMRWGIGIAVAIGGLISMGILVAGTQLAGEFEFIRLAETLAEGTGPWARSLFALGLFAAGITSAITAPFATAVVAKSLFENPTESKWEVHSIPFRSVWAVVLIIGLVFSLLKVQPIPAIILAQAINGILLPIVVFFLLILINDHQIMPPGFRHSKVINIILTAIFALVAFLGFHGLGNALLQITGFQTQSSVVRICSIMCSLSMTGIIIMRIFKNRKTGRV